MRLPWKRPWSLLLLATLLAAGVIAACASRAEHRAARPHLRIVDAVYEFTLDDIRGRPYPFAQHADQVLLLVNVASKCGYTPQYAALQALHERYRERGLVVIGIPANDFLWQEPGDDAGIAAFCSTTYGVTFPMMAKVAVTGDGQHPLYWHLTSESARPGPIRWNFTKFLVGRDGRVAERFGPGTAPDAKEVIAAIEQALARSPTYDLRALEGAILRILNDRNLACTSEEQGKLEIGLAKSMSAKIMRGPAGLVITLGRITDWEGRVPDSGIDLVDGGRVIGHQVNNLASEGEEHDALCFVHFGDCEEGVRKALVEAMGRLK